MALPKNMRLKGHRTFNYIHKNSKKYYGRLLDLKIVKSKPDILISHKNFSNLDNLKIAIAISKKVSKKSVERNRIRRKLHENFLKTFKKDNYHIPYWLLVNLKGGDFSNYDIELLKEFQFLISKSGLFK
ncbi:MAG: ribonuclease P protein component [Prochlorococcus sp. SP3034]|nr:ribonuclease P protein component [Prochlorococcus sp. SP3034]|tara:strand:+ start:1315 stop:1701 length:387 start_codon:yes stop_codon:yes gene_type:complete